MQSDDRGSAVIGRPEVGGRSDKRRGGFGAYVLGDVADTSSWEERAPNIR